MTRKFLVCLMLTVACTGLLLFELLAVGVAPSQAAHGPLEAAPASRPRLAATNVLTYALSADAAGLDPALNWDTMCLLVGAQVCETLVNCEPGGTLPVPGLAKSWSTSVNGLEWTFTLRPGVHFHDGTALDADAVIYNIERWWDPAHPYHQGSFFYYGYIFGGFRGEAGCNVATVSSVATDQVRITLKTPDSRLPSFLAMPFFAIASPNAIRAGTLQTAPVGSGAFRFDHWAQGEYVHLTANADYWGGRPRLDALTFRVIPDPATRLAALQSGAIQGATELGQSQWAAAAQDHNLRVLWRPASTIGYLGMNHARAPLDNPLVCQAIAHAVNRQAIVAQHYNSVAPVAQVAGQLISPAIWGHDPAIQDYAYDPALARSLLAEAGYSNGVTTTLWVMPVGRSCMPQPSAIASSIQADLEAVGIHVTFVTHSWSTYVAKVAAGEADLFQLGWALDYPHPHDLLGSLLCSRDMSFGPPDEVLCGLVQSALAEPDLQEQIGIYQAASRRVHDTLPLLPLAHVRDAVVLRSNVRGAVPAVMFAASFKNVYLGAVQYLPVVKRGMP